ncbi:MAG: cardiolipin synthase, partial [Oscillospiraceae bacterium]|nr:cardiolipin synthase [Oscillospiraceae bacterium]
MDNEERVVRLAKPLKKGLLHLVFSRFCVIVLLLVFQVAILIAAYGYFKDKLPILINLLWLFSLVMVVYLFNCPMDSSAKLTWMFIMAVLPLPGAAFFFFTQSNIGHRMECKLVEQQIENSRAFLRQPENVLDRLEHDGSGTDDLCRYLNRSGCFPLYDRTRVTFFPQGEDKFKAMLEQLEKAEDFIFLEYFIIEEGYMWGRILDVLTRKAKEGVEIRVMYDGMCELNTLPVDYWKLLRAEG